MTVAAVVVVVVKFPLVLSHVCVICPCKVWVDSKCASQGLPFPKVSIQSGYVGQVFKCNYHVGHITPSFWYEILVR